MYWYLVERSMFLEYTRLVIGEKLPRVERKRKVRVRMLEDERRDIERRLPCEWSQREKIQGELEEAVYKKMIIFHERHKESIRVLTRKSERTVIEMRVRQSLDIDSVRYIKKKKVKISKDKANKKRIYKAIERGAEEGWRIREGLSKIEQMSTGKREAGVADRRRKTMRLWESLPLILPKIKMEEEAESAAGTIERRKKLRWEVPPSVPPDGMVKGEYVRDIRKLKRRSTVLAPKTRENWRWEETKTRENQKKGDSDYNKKY